MPDTINCKYSISYFIPHCILVQHPQLHIQFHQQPSLKQIIICCTNSAISQLYQGFFFPRAASFTCNRIFCSSNHASSLAPPPCTTSFAAFPLDIFSFSWKISKRRRGGRKLYTLSSSTPSIISYLARNTKNIGTIP